MKRLDWILLVLVALLAWYGLNNMAESWAQAMWAYLETSERVDQYLKLLQGVK